MSNNELACELYFEWLLALFPLLHTILILEIFVNSTSHKLSTKSTCVVDKRYWSTVGNLRYMWHNYITVVSLHYTITHTAPAFYIILEYINLFIIFIYILKLILLQIMLFVYYYYVRIINLN